jgi:SAM-dependent methyltransferase
MRLAFCLLWACMSVYAQDEVPFITTPDRVTLAMLELAQVGPNDHVIDLGSGDGRIVITAAQRFGASGLGVEIVPELVRESRDNARAAGVAQRVEFREQDLFLTDLARATVVTLYLLPEINLQLRPRLLALAPGTRVVSHDWDMGDWLPERSLTLDVPDKTIGRDKQSRVHLWLVPARVDGLWCSAGASLRVTQRLGQFSAVLHAADRRTPAMVFDGRIAGTRLQARHPHDAELQADSQGLRVLHIGSAGTPVAGRTFTRAGAAGC